MNVLYGIDIGGTTIKIGKFSKNKLLNKYSIPTKLSSNPLVVIEDIKKVITTSLKNDSLIGMGVAVPGPVKNGLVLGAQNILWGEVELAKLLNKAFPNTKVAIINDANAACLGEWCFGSGQKQPNLVFITLGTGVGGGIVVDSKMIEGKNGSTGELGHIVIDPYKGRNCTCGLKGCLETYASATGITLTGRQMKKGKLTTLNNYEKLTSKIIFDEAKNGDKISKEVVDYTSYHLAVGIASICNTLNPDVVVIGGGVSKAGSYFLDKIKNDFSKLAFYSVRETDIVLASLGEDAGIYGAMTAVLIKIK